MTEPPNDFKRLEAQERLRDAYSERWTMRDASRLREILKIQTSEASELQIRRKA